jgi:hypothetical protein
MLRQALGGRRDGVAPPRAANDRGGPREPFQPVKQAASWLKANF